MTRDSHYIYEIHQKVTNLEYEIEIVKDKLNSILKQLNKEESS